jgi:hypothetical protein
VGRGVTGPGRKKGLQSKGFKEMTDFIRCWGLELGLVLALAMGPALAQENLNAGKTPAQLYASDCAICHKSPQGMSRAAGMLGLDSFLREHYTSSHESAAAITAYIQSVDRGPPPKETRVKRNAKREGGHERKAKAVLPPSKPGEAKSQSKIETKPAEAKSENKSESKTETKAETKPDSKTEKKSAAKPKAAGSKDEAAKTDSAKTDSAKSGDDKPAKDDKPKSD